MKTIIPNLISNIISLCCNTTKNQPRPPEECDPYKDDPFAIANIKSNIDIEKMNSKKTNDDN